MSYRPGVRAEAGGRQLRWSGCAHGCRTTSRHLEAWALPRSCVSLRTNPRAAFLSPTGRSILSGGSWRTLWVRLGDAVN